MSGISHERVRNATHMKCRIHLQENENGLKF